MMTSYKNKGEGIPEETKNVLNGLEKKIEKAIDEVCASSNVKEVFAKLSSRSPKDATNRKQKKKHY